MHGNEIRHVATSPHGTLFIVAQFERRVQIWNLRTRKRIAAFPTTLDFGGRRLAITADGRHCIVGAYNVFGIASYDSRSGKEVWRRKDLKKVQYVRMSNDDKRIYCCFTDGPCRVLDRRAGDTIDTLRGVRKIWESAYETIALLDRRTLVLETKGDELLTLPRAAVAVVGAAFGPGQLCVVESRGPVRCFHTLDGQEMWRYAPSPDIHVLRLAYCEKVKAFIGVEVASKHGGAKRLISLDPATGECDDVAYIGEAPAFGFCRGASQLITSWGQLWDVKTGQTVASFDFTGDS